MIKQSIIENVLEAALSTGGDFSEVFVEDRYANTLELQSGKVEKSLSGRDAGVGIRIFAGLQSVYTYTTDFSEEGLLKAAKRAAHAIKAEGRHMLSALQHEQTQQLHNIIQMPRTVENNRKADYMKKAYEVVKNYDERIRQAGIRYLDEEQHVLIANSEGKFVEDTRIRTRLAIQAIATEGNNTQTGFYGPGAYQGFEFIENLDLNHYAGEAARIAVTMLGADECPSGKFPVIIDNEFGGVIFHEACGHGLEATSVAKNNSVFANRNWRESCAGYRDVYR